MFYESALDFFVKRFCIQTYMEKILDTLKKLVDGFINPHAAVAVVRLNGVIGKIGNSRNGINIADLEEPLEKAFKTSNLKAVAITINSPGGSPVQSSIIYTRIRALAKQYNVKVYTYAEDIAASGGYWLLCSGDEIYCNENSIIGSIGVISAGFGFHSLIKKLGIERRVYTEGEAKMTLDPFQPEKEDDIKRLKSVQKDIHDSFINLVKESRALKLKDTEEDIFNGQFWSGKKAVEYGLVDGIAELKEHLRGKFGEKIRFKEIATEKSGFLRKLGLPIGKSQSISSMLDEAEMWSRFG